MLYADNDTIEYYNLNAREYFENTVNVDMTDLYALFETHLCASSYILDLGCGSGRDTKHFLSKGFQVTAVEPSSSLAKLACDLTGIHIINARVQDLSFVSLFDGIWACASLLHIPYEEMPMILRILHRSLKYNGVLFMSLKKSEFMGIRNGRFFCDYTIQRFESLKYRNIGFSLVEFRESTDKRPDRDNEVWLNVLLKKTDNHKDMP